MKLIVLKKIQDHFSNIVDDKIKELIKLEKIDDLYLDIESVDGYMTCSICLSDTIYHVVFNCKHNVCVKCYIHVYDHNNICHYKCNIDIDHIKLLKFNY